ncbi:MAG: PKHD-type hydroxylase, partial [Rhodospirillaceae bacterium]|nr:PKHD-type hydroxylase [Rhodospirillaceae bacterium]
EGERSLLFDLDRTVQNLSLSLPGDHHELVRLTGIYHNLLRRWALT